MSDSDPTAASAPPRDRGAILPIVLVVSVALSMVVVAVATYTTTTLRYGHVVEARADRLAAAEAAMNDALERLRIVDGLCTTSSADGQPVNPNFPPINGVAPMVTCGTYGAEVPPQDGWAIVVTGEGPAAAGGVKTFITRAGGNPVLEGPVFVHDPTRLDFKSTTIKNGSLWYTDAACAGASPNADDRVFKDSNLNIPSLSFDPTTRKQFCINWTWDKMFATTPPEAHISASLPTAPPYQDLGGCRVFFPGRYTTANKPQLASHNYFESGNYFFDNIGPLSLHQNRLTFGDIDPEQDPIFPLLPISGPCETARSNDPDKGGATVYLGGSSRIDIGAQSQFEVAGRQQGEYIVALHVLSSSTPATVIEAGSGGNKDSAFSGLVWAPKSRIEIGTVSVSKDAAFRGGMVVGVFEGTVSNSGNDKFLIRVPTSQQSVTLVLDANATDDRGTTTIRVVADYRPYNGALAVRSWRVCATAGCA
ncbi:hypothetical protein BH23ACT3_BH23ACT3_13070 [soil metagenome]